MANTIGSAGAVAALDGLLAAADGGSIVLLDEAGSVLASRTLSGDAFSVAAAGGSSATATGSLPVISPVAVIASGDLASYQLLDSSGGVLIAGTAGVGADLSTSAGSVQSGGSVAIVNWALSVPFVEG